MNKSILIICYGGGHVNIINEVLMNSNVINSLDINIITLTSAKNRINNQSNYNVKNLIDYRNLFSKDEQSKIEYYGKILIKDNHNENSVITKQESVFYLGLSFFDLTLENGYNKAMELYNINQRQSFFPVYSISKIIEFISPDFLLTTNSPRFEAASILACRNLNIPSIQILDLFGDDFPLPSANYIIVMGDYVANKLKNQIRNSKILALGQPVFEKTVKSVKQINSIKIKNEIGLSLESKIITFAPCPYIKYDENFKIIHYEKTNRHNDEIFKIFSDLTNLGFQVLVKIHPSSDSESNYFKYINNKNIFLIDNQTYSIYDTISVSDCFVSFNSTTILEAILCGKIGVSFNYNEKDIYNNEFKDSPFFHSKSIKELKKTILNSFKQKKFKNEMIYSRNFTTKFDNFLKSII